MGVYQVRFRLAGGALDGAYARAVPDVIMASGPSMHKCPEAQAAVGLAAAARAAVGSAAAEQAAAEQTAVGLVVVVRCYAKSTSNGTRSSSCRKNRLRSGARWAAV